MRHFLLYIQIQDQENFNDFHGNFTAEIEWFSIH